MCSQAVKVEGQNLGQISNWEQAEAHNNRRTKGGVKMCPKQVGTQAMLL